MDAVLAAGLASTDAKSEASDDSDHLGVPRSAVDIEVVIFSVFTVRLLLFCCCCGPRLSQLPSSASPFSLV